MPILRKSYIFISPVLFLLIKFILTFFANNFLIGTILSVIFFIFFTLANITGGDFSFMKDVGFETFLNLFERYSILRIYIIFSLLLMIVTVGFSRILKLDSKLMVLLKPEFRFIAGSIIITFLMILAQVSIYFPKSGEGAESIRPILFIFWLVSLLCYLIYTMIMSFINSLSSKY